MGECMWAMSLLHNKIAKKIRIVAGSSDMGGFMVADNLANFTKTIKKYVMFCFFHNLWAGKNTFPETVRGDDIAIAIAKRELQ